MPHGHWKTTTFLAGLRASGWVSPLVIDGALNGALFLNYVRQQLAPALEPGDILILDNLASHKVRGVREEIERVGADQIDRVDRRLFPKVYLSTTSVHRG